MVFFGEEREYAPHAPGADALNRLSAEVTRRVPHLPGCASAGAYTPMGRFYLDIGARPEWASIESDDPDDVLRSILVGEMLLRDAARASNVELYRSNVDYCGSTGACHMNFACTVDRGTMYDQLVPLLASQVIFGSGGLVPDHPGIMFTMSPRCSSYIHKTVSSSTDRERGICHMRNEPLAQSSWRAHITGVDSTLCHRCTWLRLASAAAVVWAVETGARPAERVRLRDPVPAMQRFCTDPTCRAVATTVYNTKVTAIDIQRTYLSAVRERITRADCPGWTALACQRWQRVLDAIQADPRAVTCVDWCIKLKLFEDWARSRHGIKLNDPPKFNCGMGWEALGCQDAMIDLRSELTEIDLRFGALNPPGLFDQLEERGAPDHHVAGVSDTVSVANLPTGGRAAARAREIVRLCGTPEACCEWDRVFDGRGRVVYLPDPHSTRGSWHKEEPCWTMRRSIGAHAARVLQSLRRTPPGR